MITAAGQPMAMSGDAGRICSFSATADASFVIYVQTYPDLQCMSPMKQFEAGGEHLPGLGDDAFWGNGIVFVQKGSRGLAVTLQSLTASPAAVKAHLVTLATAALGRF